MFAPRYFSLKPIHECNEDTLILCKALDKNIFIHSFRLGTKKVNSMTIDNLVRKMDLKGSLKVLYRVKIQFMMNEAKTMQTSYLIIKMFYG